MENVNTTIIERDYTQDEISSCGLLYNKIVRQHKACNGTGLVLDEDQVSLCDCENIYKYVQTLMYSNIPKGHWGVASNLNIYENKKHYKLVVDSLPDSNWGITGLGKTTALVSLAKLAISKGYNVFYLKAETLLKYIRNDETAGSVYLERTYGADLILIDDLDKYTKSDWASNQLNLFISARVDAGQGIIISLSDVSDANKIKLTSSDKLLGWLRVNFNAKLFKKIKQSDYFQAPFLDEALEYSNINSV
jgi:hypothetical protein